MGLALVGGRERAEVMARYIYNRTNKLSMDGARYVVRMVEGDSTHARRFQTVSMYVGPVKAREFLKRFGFTSL